MQISIANVLSASEVLAARAALAAALFVDGRETAGYAARLVKDNQQAAGGEGIDALRARLVARVKANAVFDLAARPKAIGGVLFSRYRTGHGYGAHVDNALIDGLRTDVAFTLFLSDPASYAGGELVLETAAGEDAIKLAAGDLVVYPATTLHRVATVGNGERLAMVGWVQSLVRDAGRREILFDLDSARRALFERHGKTAEYDLLAKSAANLLRMWVDG